MKLQKFAVRGAIEGALSIVQYQRLRALEVSIVFRRNSFYSSIYSALEYVQILESIALAFLSSTMLAES